MTSKLPTQPSDLTSPTTPKSTVKGGGLHSAHEPLRCPYQTTGSEAWKDTEIKKMEEEKHNLFFEKQNYCHRDEQKECV